MISIKLKEKTKDLELRQFLSCDKELSDEIKIIIKEFSEIIEVDQSKIINDIIKEQNVDVNYIFEEKNSSILNL